MTFAGALDATQPNPWPITCVTAEGLVMYGYLDGSVDVVKGSRRVKVLPSGAGPALGRVDWQAGTASLGETQRRMADAPQRA